MGLFRLLNYYLGGVSEFDGLIAIMGRVELQVKIETLRQILYLIKRLRDIGEGLDKLDQIITRMLIEYQSELDDLILSEPVYKDYYKNIIEVVKPNKQLGTQRAVKTPT